MTTVADRPLSVKLRPWLEEELRREFEDRGESTSEGLRRVLEEWWALREFPAIEFRDGIAGRRAALSDGPEVWEVVVAFRDHDGDEEALRDHFAWLDGDALEDALAYYERFPDRVNGVIEENERTARYLAERFG